MTRMAMLQAREFGALRQLFSSSSTPESLTHHTPLIRNAHMVRKSKDSQKHYWVLIGILIIISSPSGYAFPSFVKFHSALWTSLNLGFEILFHRVFGHPTCNFRTFRVISRTDQAWSACVTGDLEQMERLFAHGQASPYDTTQDGATLLHVSIQEPRIIVWGD